jgi:hypothetical protein
VLVYRDVSGTPNEQPWHLDGTVPWRPMGPGGKLWTPIGAVVQFSDGPGTVLGGFISDIWRSGNDAVVAKKVNSAFASLAGPLPSEALDLKRAGNTVIFPMGSVWHRLACFGMTFIFFFSNKIECIHVFL